MSDTRYEDFVRARITELRLKKNVSEHKMSLELGKSGSYIRSITSGAALPSLKELLNIMAYVEVSPSAFFEPLENKGTPYQRLLEQLRKLNDEELQKVLTFVEWIK